ncbi:thiamine pyrophosphate-binding protein, partial [Candidatus Thioglobus sp.]|nr:thiamine pyrophosphate-binding protein [Candidatus Thioglobus sp.]
TSMHCHPGKKTSLVVLEGKVSCSNITKTLDRSAGEGLLIEKGVFHQTTTISKTGAFVMEIETPVNKRDLVRLKDKYGREGKGYETEDQHSFNTQNYNYISLQNLDIQYNLKKHFGQCSMVFKKLTDEKILDEILELNPTDIICILEGKLLRLSNQSVIDVGDTMTVKTLKKFGRLHASRNTEILIIKKVDRILKISDCVASFLSKKNIKPVFIVPGEANVHLLDSIGRHEDLSFVCIQNEKSASLAVESFCKLRSDLGVLVVSSGAAAANTVPGVANAWVDSVPMLVISGQARTDQDADGQVRQLGNKALNIVDLVKSITKYAVKVTDPTMVLYHLEKAVYLATHGRPGPIWVDLPIDIQGMDIDEKDLKWFDPKELSSVAIAPENNFHKEILQVIHLLNNSSRPVILAGSGVRHAKAAKEFLELISRLKIPVLCSRRGADLVPDDHPYFFGRPGTYGQRGANFVIQNCDLLINIGSRLSIPQIGRNTKTFARAAYKVVVDIDPNELEKPTLKPDLPLAMDAGKFIKECLSLLPTPLPSYSSWMERCREWRVKFPPDSYTGPSLPSDPPENGLIYPLPLLRILAAELGEDDVVVADGGAALIYTLLAFRFKSGQRLISSTGLELPGFALAGAIGASVASDCRPVVCICEDHGFQNSIQDIQTILDYRLPIKVLILKSKGHAIIRNIQRDYFGGRFVGTDHELRLGSAPLIQIAKTFGLPTFDLVQTSQLASTLQEWLKHEGPAVCQIQVEDDHNRIPRPGFAIRDDQKWVAKPLEDMYPLLDRKTLQENMMINLIKED